MLDLYNYSPGEELLDVTKAIITSIGEVAKEIKSKSFSIKKLNAKQIGLHNIKYHGGGNPSKLAVNILYNISHSLLSDAAKAAPRKSYSPKKTFSPFQHKHHLQYKKYSSQNVLETKNIFKGIGEVVSEGLNIIDKLVMKIADFFTEVTDNIFTTPQDSEILSNPQKLFDEINTLDSQSVEDNSSAEIDRIPGDNYLDQFVDFDF